MSSGDFQFYSISGGGGLGGVVSVFLVHVIRAFIKGRPEWFLTVLLLPLVAIGLGLIAYVGYALLRVFTPAAVRTLEAAGVRSGAAAIQVPRGVVPSFTASNNKIVWCIRVEGRGYPVVRWIESARPFRSWLELQGHRQGMVTDHVLLLDGAEQLCVWFWRSVIWRWRGIRALLITTHHSGRLPTVISCETSKRRLREQVCELLVGEQIAQAQGASDNMFEFFGVAGFGEVLMGQSGESHRQISIAIIPEGDADHFWVPLHDEVQKLLAVHSGHGQVGHDDVYGVPKYLGQRLLSTLDEQHFPIGRHILQEILQAVQLLWVVVDKENPLHVKVHLVRP